MNWARIGCVQAYARHMPGTWHVPSTDDVKDVISVDAVAPHDVYRAAVPTEYNKGNANLLGYRNFNFSAVNTRR